MNTTILLSLVLSHNFLLVDAKDKIEKLPKRIVPLSTKKKKSAEKRKEKIICTDSNREKESSFLKSFYSYSQKLKKIVCPLAALQRP